MRLSPCSESEAVSILVANGIKLSSAPSKRGAFILRDGRFLNLADNKTVIMGADICPTHHDFGLFWVRIGVLDPIDSFYSGTIKLNAGSSGWFVEEPYVHIPKQGMTEAQASSLAVWLDELRLGPKKEVYAVNESNGRCGCYDLRLCSSHEMVCDIRRNLPE
jgi:hypothetical protein